MILDNLIVTFKNLIWIYFFLGIVIKRDFWYDIYIRE